MGKANSIARAFVRAVNLVHVMAFKEIGNRWPSLPRPASASVKNRRPLDFPLSFVPAVRNTFEAVEIIREILFPYSRRPPSEVGPPLSFC
jgi:hypothetical protein